MKLVKCDISDCLEIIKLGRKTYYETFHALNNKDTMTKYLDEAFDENKISAELANPLSCFYLLYEKQKTAGYIKVNFSSAQSDINDPESLELERIYVDVEFKGQGFGKLLIEKALSIAVDHKLKYVWLGVWKKNEKALGFYKKMGFKIFDTHTFRMGDELQNDYILKKMIFSVL